LKKPRILKKEPRGNCRIATMASPPLLSKTSGIAIPCTIVIAIAPLCYMSVVLVEHEVKNDDKWYKICNSKIINMPEKNSRLFCHTFITQFFIFMWIISPKFVRTKTNFLRLIQHFLFSTSSGSQMKYFGHVCEWDSIVWIIFKNLGILNSSKICFN
jgi:hypothetical protein